MSPRPHNFNAGPAILPLAVMEEVQGSLLDTNGTGLSVMEWSHRSPEYDAVRGEVQERLFRLLGLEGDHGFRLLLLQGGASLQFAMVPMNLGRGRKGAYVLTGAWAKKALAEAARIGLGEEAWSGAETNFNRLPAEGEWDEPDACAYVHVTSNNTIFGTQYKQLPRTEAPLVIDMSSDILSGPIDMDRIGLIYAGAQKNLGPAGVTVVLVREDLLGEAPDGLPAFLDYRVHLKADAIYNTPNTFGVYLMGRVLAWIEGHGGLEGMALRNAEKAQVLYDEIGRTGFYRTTAAADSQSRMNVTFRLPSEDLEKQFIQEAKSYGFVGLKGHRSVGGCRASIYNACPPESVQALVSFMREFEKTNG
ncbi:MAG: 3-phosphoserine/phosphohydroxythreonine transaminase [Planctomycetes bacterium]|nr:3-phosphoserine/phosphohydroxythreonine transaminase [Planctomycetota bacterium]